MGIQIIKNVIGTTKETVYAGYDRINWQTAIGFLDFVVKEYAIEERLTIRNNNYLVDGERWHQERILTDTTGTDVVRFFLKVNKNG